MGHGYYLVQFLYWMKIFWNSIVMILHNFINILNPLSQLYHSKQLFSFLRFISRRQCQNIQNEDKFKHMYTNLVHQKLQHISQGNKREPKQMRHIIFFLISEVSIYFHISCLLIIIKEVQITILGNQQHLQIIKHICVTKKIVFYSIGWIKSYKLYPQDKYDQPLFF